MIQRNRCLVKRNGDYIIVNVALIVCKITLPLLYKCITHAIICDSSITNLNYSGNMVIGDRYDCKGDNNFTLFVY